jgi:hypothetical protein
MADIRSEDVPDLSGGTGRELHYTVQPGLSSAIHLKVDPSSVWSVGFEDDPDSRLTIIADSAGAIRFHVHSVESSPEIVRLAVESDSEGRGARHGIELRFDHEPTTDMPRPPQPGVSIWTDDTRLRRPLSMSELLSTAEEELLERRYPARPNPDEAPRAFEFWRRAVSAPAVEVDPGLVERPGVTHGLAQAGPATRRNWSGFELRETGFMQRIVGGKPVRYDWVTGTWHVPFVLGHAQGRDYSCVWVGIDGDGVSDLYQAGTEQDVITGKIGSIAVSLGSYYAWTEFLPQEKFEQTISGFATYPGDEIFACVWIGDAGSAPKLEGAFGFTYIHNFRTGEFSFIPTDRGRTLVGGTEAEWIVERTQITPAGGTPYYPTLADYGKVVMSGAYARFADSPFGTGYVPYQGSSNLQLTMTDSAGAVLSTVRPLDTQSMEFRWGDPRFRLPGVFEQTRARFP